MGGARVTKDTEMYMETTRKMEDSSLISTCMDGFVELNEKYADELATLYDDDNACTVMNNWTTCIYYGDTEPFLPKFNDFCEGTMGGKTILMDIEHFETEDNRKFHFAEKPYCVPKTCVEASYLDVIYKMHNALRFFSFYLKKDMSLKCRDNFGSYEFWMDSNVQQYLDEIERLGATPLIRYQGGKHSCYGSVSDRTNCQTILSFKEVSDPECLDPGQLFFEVQELWHQRVKLSGVVDPFGCEAIVPVTLLEVYEPSSGTLTLAPVTSAPVTSAPVPTLAPVSSAPGVNLNYRTKAILSSFLFSMLAAAMV